MKRAAPPSRTIGVVQDRRTHMRLDVSLPCTFCVGGITRPGEIIRLSMSGCFIGSNNWYPCRGDEVMIVIPADGDPVSLQGQVTRVGVCSSKRKVQSGFAARFAGPRADLLAMIRNQPAKPAR